MLVLLVFAFVSGVITILSPCILPVLPIVLSGGIGGGKARPFGVIAGFVVSFSFFTLALSAIVEALGVPADAMRWVAIVLIGLFGIVMLVPRLREGFDMFVSRIASRGGTSGKAAERRPGFWGGIPVGLSLGLIWTPCVGPIMASVISLALTQKVDGGSVFITVAYTLGTAIPMLAVMFGGRALLAKVPSLSRNAPNIQRGFGVVMILMAVAIGFQWDRSLQASILRAFPSYGSGLTAVENLSPVKLALAARNRKAAQAAIPGTATIAANETFSGAPAESTGEVATADYGAAPPFVASGPWFNTGSASNGIPEPSTPLSLSSLRGKVVIVDFWTYSCVNCVRTIPYLKAWYEKYRDKGLVIVGVHSPEFAFERVQGNVSRAMRDLGVTWPVVMDNDYKEWNAWGNRYWPAHYFIDAKGRVRSWHFGEGHYIESEKLIQELLKESGATVTDTVSAPDLKLASNTPETYLGYARGRGLASAVRPIADTPTAYTPARSPGNGEWTLNGVWTIHKEYVQPASKGTLQFGFDAKDVYLVVEPAEGGGSISASLDGSGKAEGPDLSHGMLVPDVSRLYHIVALKSASSHVLTLDIKGNLRLFAFTFG
ncbi:MAG: cytochrome c biogenesis protein DipZ [Rectinemataceae bacterium]